MCVCVYVSFAKEGPTDICWHKNPFHLLCLFECGPLSFWCWRLHIQGEHLELWCTVTHWPSSKLYVLIVAHLQDCSTWWILSCCVEISLFVFLYHFLGTVVAGQGSWRSSSSLQHHADEGLVTALVNGGPISCTPRAFTPCHSRMSSQRLCFSGK